MRLLTPLLLAAAFAAPAAADTPEKAAAFIGAMRDANCDMSLEEADVAAEELGIEIEELDDIIDLLFVAGQLEIDSEDHMTLVPELCAGNPAEDADFYARLDATIDMEAAMEPFFGAPVSLDAVPAPERGAQFIAALRARDCAVRREEAETLLGVTGFSPSEAETAVAILFEAGHLLFGLGPDELQLSQEACAADPAGDPAMFETATEMVVGAARPVDPDVVIANHFGPDGIRVVLEFLADSSDCVLDTSDREDAVDSVVAFLAYNVTGVYNLPPEFSPEAEAELRGLIDDMLDDPGPAFQSEPGQLTLIDCTP